MARLASRATTIWNGSNVLFLELHFAAARPARAGRALSDCTTIALGIRGLAQIILDEAWELVSRSEYLLRVDRALRESGDPARLNESSSCVERIVGTVDREALPSKSPRSGSAPVVRRSRGATGGASGRPVEYHHSPLRSQSVPASRSAARPFAPASSSIPRVQEPYRRAMDTRARCPSTSSVGRMRRVMSPEKTCRVSGSATDSGHRVIGS